MTCRAMRILLRCSTEFWHSLGVPSARSPALHIVVADGLSWGGWLETAENSRNGWKQRVLFCNLLPVHWGCHIGLIRIIFSGHMSLKV